MAVNFDTHATVKELTQAGFTEPQAEALVRAVAGQRHDPATKADLESSRIATKADIDALRVDLDAVKRELQLHRWVLGLLVGLQLASLGLLFNIMRVL